MTPELEAWDGLSIEELMGIRVDAPSPWLPLTARESPGVVTVITREEIAESGARDLIDVLQLVPGLSFGADVQGVVGVGVRGVWCHEGKVLLRVDGQEFNELDYSTTQLGNRFPVELIERVEIVRGPGSAVYGGFAELAVVNVVLRSVDDVHGAAVHGYYGQTEADFARRNLGLFFAAPIEGVDGLSVSALALVGQGQRSDRTYTDFDGDFYAMAGHSALDPRFFATTIAYEGLRVRFLYDGYRTTTADGFGNVIPEVEQSFTGFHAEAQYAWKLGDKVTLTPRFNFKRQSSWRVTDRTSPLFASRHVDRYVERLDLSWSAARHLTLDAGVEVTEDHAALDDPFLGGLQYLYDGKVSANWWNGAVFGEALYLGPIAHVHAGLRYELHSAYGGSLVPRVVITKVLEPFHAKLLYNGAFRAPAVQNINLNPDIRPERTTAFEAEAGARIGRYMLATVNAFDLTLTDPIVYASEEIEGELVESYENAGRTGSRGIEATWRAWHPIGRVQVGYSFYTSGGKNDVETYAVPGRKDLLLAFPAHKLTVDGSLRVGESFSVNPTAVLLGERYAWTGPAEVTRFPPVAMLNVFLQYRDLGIDGLDVGAGVYNILDADAPYLQPYEGGHAPLPAGSREYVARVIYTYRFD
ncbi:MAG: TonB-dependent receptor plug domain-containing protein [Pseudomonadota bacterium]|nr:TonB-dependent receptor plug domain-containing protein [Pseudomonadota bacterium]